MTENKTISHTNEPQTFKREPSNQSLSDNDEEDNSSAQDSDSDSDSNSDSDSDSSSGDEPLLKPTFIPKSKRSKQHSSRQAAAKASESGKKERTLNQIQLHIQQDIEYMKQQMNTTQNYGGIDDTDGIDPDEERAAWEARQTAREERDNEKLLNEQEEFEELEMRRMQAEEDKEKL